MKVRARSAQQHGTLRKPLCSFDFLKVHKGTVMTKPLCFATVPLKVRARSAQQLSVPLILQLYLAKQHGTLRKHHRAADSQSVT